MIEKEYKNYVLVCDSCDDSEMVEQYDEAIKFAKENDWKFKLEKGIWYHYCQNCKQML